METEKMQNMPPIEIAHTHAVTDAHTDHLSGILY